jgi:hypothetical protein
MKSRKSLLPVTVSMTNRVTLRSSGVRGFGLGAFVFKGSSFLFLFVPVITFMALSNFNFGALGGRITCVFINLFGTVRTLLGRS